MKNFTKLVAVGAAAMTFGITGANVNACPISQTYRQNLQNAQNKMNQVPKLDTDSSKDGVSGNWDLMQEKDVLNKSANTILSPSFANADSTPQDVLGTGNAIAGMGKKTDSDYLADDYKQSEQTQNATALYNAEQDVINAIYANTNDGSNAQPAASNANKQTANNDNKQSANNNNNANAQNNSSNKKADVVANANNSNAKNNDAQGAVANKQNTNNKANAQQNTVKSNANVEGVKTVANENESNSAKNQNNGAIAETQNENTTAAGETSTVVKAQAKSASNSAAQKNNTPVFPQTGEQTSEILAVAGGLIIAATAAGIVVYKKRN